MGVRGKLNQDFIKRSLTVIGLTVLVLLFLALIFFAFDLLLLFFSAVLLAIFFRGLGDLVRRATKFPETVSIIIAALVLIGAFALGGWLLAPDIAEQVRNLREFLPRAALRLNEYLSGLEFGKLILEQIPDWHQISDQVISGAFLIRVSGFFSTTVGSIVNVLVVLLLALYLSFEPRIYVNGFVRLFPKPGRVRVREVLDAIGETLRRWMVGKFFSMLIIGVATTIGLGLLGVPLALTLGLIAALLTFIPNFGPLIALAPAFLIALVESPWKALYVVILYAGIQLVESYLITPLIERETVSLPPVLTILFQIFLGLLVGGLGLVLATPLLAVILVAVNLLYIEDVLGDRMESEKV